MFRNKGHFRKLRYEGDAKGFISWKRLIEILSKFLINQTTPKFVGIHSVDFREFESKAFSGFYKIRKVFSENREFRDRIPHQSKNFRADIVFN